LHPVRLAKKSRQSLPFFGEKATQRRGRADFCAAKPHLVSLDQPSAILRSSALLLFFHGLKARLPAFKPKFICQKVGVVFFDVS
jgi:hypothetical protein